MMQALSAAIRFSRHGVPRYPADGCFHSRLRDQPQAAKRRADGHVAYLLGGIENELTAARLALKEMIAAAATNEPGFETTNRVMIGRTLVARGVLKTLELAMEAAGVEPSIAQSS